MTTPRKDLQERMEKEVKSHWQPRVRAQARAHAVSVGGMRIHVRGFNGSTGTGSSNDGRLHDIGVNVSPIEARELIDAQEAGATEDDLLGIVADILTHAYFLDVVQCELVDVEELDFDFH